MARSSFDIITRLDSQSLEIMFKATDVRQLPSYKDKPYNYSSAPLPTKRPIYRRRRVVLAVLAVLGIIFLFIIALRSQSTAGEAGLDGLLDPILRSIGLKGPEMELVSGGMVVKGRRPKLMREGGRAWVEFPDGTKKKLQRKGSH